MVSGSGSATINGRRNGAGAFSTRVDRGHQIIQREQRAAGVERAERQRPARTREPQQFRHVALHARAVDQHQPQRHPVEIEVGEPAFGRELGAAIGVGRLRRQVLGQHTARRPGRSGRGSRTERRSAAPRPAARRARGRWSPRCSAAGNRPPAVPTWRARCRPNGSRRRRRPAPPTCSAAAPGRRPPRSRPRSARCSAAAAARAADSRAWAVRAADTGR